MLQGMARTQFSGSSRKKRGPLKRPTTTTCRRSPDMRARRASPRVSLPAMALTSALSMPTLGGVFAIAGGSSAPGPILAPGALGSKAPGGVLSCDAKYAFVQSNIGDPTWMHLADGQKRMVCEVRPPSAQIRLRGGTQRLTACQQGGAAGRSDAAENCKPSHTLSLRSAALHMLEFGAPPALFLYFVMAVISNPNSSVELVTFCTAAAAAMAAETVTFPMDALKASMQLKNRDKQAENTPSLSRLERMGLFYYGLRAALFRTIPYTGTRMMMYGVFKTLLAVEGAPQSALVLATLATAAGVLSQLIISPMDLFKVRMQSDAARVRRGQEPIYDSLPQLMARTCRQEGLQGLWTGCKVNAMRAGVMNIADLAVTDVVRSFVGPSALGQLAVSAVTGISVVVLGCPVDTVRSKLMAEGPSSQQPRYNGIMDTVHKTWMERGVGGFYSSIVPMYLREGPYYFILWNVLAVLRHLRTVALQ